MTTLHHLFSSFLRLSLKIVPFLCLPTLYASPEQVNIPLNEYLFTVEQQRLGTETAEPRRLILSTSEQQWLDQNKMIYFTGDPDWLPYEAFDQNGIYIGIVAEHLKIIEQKLGINLKIVPTKTWGESVTKVKLGKVDVLSETSDSELQSLLNFTENYLSSPIIIVMKSDEDYVENLNQIKQRKIAVIKDYGYVAEIIKQYPNFNPYYVDTVQEGLTAVATGKVEVLLATLAQASYHMSELGMNNIRIVGKTEFTTKLSFGMSQRFSPLIPLFNRALNSITPNEKQAILDKWGKQKFAERADYRWLAKVIAILLLFMLFMLFWVKKLAKEMTLRKEAELQTKTVIDSIPLQILITTAGGDVLLANPKASNDYNLKLEKLSQYNIVTLYANLDDRRQLLKALSNGDKVEQKILAMKQSDGTVRSMMASITPIKFYQQPAFLTIAVDMTERLEMESALQIAKDHAESATRTKSEFLANMSHEIRTPMNAIIGFTELLNEQIEEPKLKSFAKTIQSASNNLLSLINDILDLSKIEAGKLRIEKTHCNLHDLFTDLTNIFMLTMREKNIDFILNIDDHIPQSLYMDVTRLRQVLLNLLGNAVKFTENGFIKIRVRTDNEDQIHGTVDLWIDIEDSGIGIAEDQRILIFQEFEQSREQNSGKYGGTGLGLSISKHLIEMMGGQILLQSQLNIGSTFTIKLTAIEVTSLGSTSKLELPLINKTYIKFKPAVILIVDDVQDNQNLLLAHFENTALQTITAANGLEAVNLAKQQLFDLILMDIKMPVMDGYQAAEEIKSFSSTPIVALTSSLITDGFERKKNGLFNGYLRKPVLRGDLMDELCKFLTFTAKVVPKNQEAAPAPTLTADEKIILPSALIDLNKLLPLYELGIKNNSISDIKQFSDVLSTLVKQYPISLITEYSSQIEQAVESFDIATLKQTLNSYPQLLARLESFT